MNNELLVSASDLFFEASLGITPWNDALEVFARGAGAAGANVMPIRAQVPGSFEFTYNLEELLVFYFRNELYKNCIRARGIPALARKGVMVDADCATEEEYRTDPYYQEFLRPHGFWWGAYVGFNIDNDLWAVLLHRDLNGNRFSEAEQLTLRRFCDRMSVAGTVARKLMHTKTDAMNDAFDLVDVAGVFFDRAGNIVRVNAKAEGMLTGGIDLFQGQITTPRSGDGLQVKAVACNAIKKIGTEDVGDGIVRLARRGKRDLVMKIHGLRGNLLDIFNTGWAVGILIDPDENTPRDDMRLARVMFGLTAAEAKFASLLEAGMDLAQAAEICCITYETARSHVRSIFAKTDTSKQGELIALLNRLR